MDASLVCGLLAGIFLGMLMNNMWWEGHVSAQYIPKARFPQHRHLVYDAVREVYYLPAGEQRPTPHSAPSVVATGATDDRVDRA